MATLRLQFKIYHWVGLRGVVAISSVGLLCGLVVITFCIIIGVVYIYLPHIHGFNIYHGESTRSLVFAKDAMS